MNKRYEPGILLPFGSVPPDGLDELHGNYPPPNLVVSRDYSGNPISHYCDNKWDMSFYSPRKKKSFFVFELNVAKSAGVTVVSEIKFLLFCFVWIRDGAPLSFNYIHSFLCVLKCVARYAIENGASVFQVLGSEQTLIYILQKRPGIAEMIGTMLNHFDRVEELVGLYRGPPKRFIKMICNIGMENRKRVKQTAPIPPRIYTHFIGKLLYVMEEWGKNESLILEGIRLVVNWLVACLAECDRSNDKFNTVIRRLPPPKLPDDLIVYLKSRSRRVGWVSVIHEIGYFFFIFKSIILAFSGMRRAEVDILPFDCLQIVTGDDGDFYLINGFTTKYNNGIRKKAVWVTSAQAGLAISAAQKVTLIISRAIYGDIKNNMQLPLFISYRIRGDWPIYKMFPPEYEIEVSIRERDLDFLWCRITDSDLVDLEHIDCFRYWRLERKYLVGQRWPFSVHQLRRSLALYAHQSGIVSLPSLRRQLQHVTLAMTRYYSSGSRFSDDFLVFHGDHFGYLWRNTKAESQAVGYFLQVILSELPLEGGHGTWISRAKEKNDFLSNESRENTLRLMQKGQLAYTETIIGGCTKVGACDQPAVDWINYECLAKNCKNLVINPERLKMIVKAQSQFIEQFPVDSLEHRSGLRELSLFKKYLTEVQSDED